MKKQREEEQYSMQNAMNKLAEICKIIFEDNKLIFLKKSEEIDETLLKTLSLSFTTLSTLFEDAIEHWFGSKLKGPDAVQPSEKLEDRIDIKLYQTGSLDFEQLKRIMVRLNRIDDALGGIERIAFYLTHYENICKAKGLNKYAELSELFRVYSIEEFGKSLKMEASQLRGKVERSNLYFQSKLNTTTVRIAYFALAISVLSVLITILWLLFGK